MKQNTKDLNNKTNQHDLTNVVNTKKKIKKEVSSFPFPWDIVQDRSSKTQLSIHLRRFQSDEVGSLTTTKLN